MEEFNLTPKTRSTPVKIPFTKTKFDPMIKIPILSSTPSKIISPLLTPIKEEVKKEEVKIISPKKEEVLPKKEVKPISSPKKEEVLPKKEVKPIASPKKSREEVKPPRIKYESMTEEEKEKEYDRFEAKFDLLRKDQTLKYQK